MRLYYWWGLIRNSNRIWGFVQRLANSCTNTQTTSTELWVTRTHETEENEKDNPLTQQEEGGGCALRRVSCFRCANTRPLARSIVQLDSRAKTNRSESGELAKLSKKDAEPTITDSNKYITKQYCSPVHLKPNTTHLSISYKHICDWERGWGFSGGNPGVIPAQSCRASWQQCLHRTTVLLTQ